MLKREGTLSVQSRRRLFSPGSPRSTLTIGLQNNIFYVQLCGGGRDGLTVYYYNINIIKQRSRGRITGAMGTVASHVVVAVRKSDARPATVRQSHVPRVDKHVELHGLSYYIIQQ